jgi:hypothetical protein
MGSMSRRTVVAVLAAAFAAAPAAADEVFLRGGGHVTGVIVERTKDAVVLETAPGRVTLPVRRIERIVESRSALEVFRERAADLAPGDVDGWAALARWAAERDLLTQAREAWQAVLAVNPSHPEANAALGRVALDGAWMAEADAYRARGYVEFEGRWVTPAEHEALVRERAAEETSARETREGELRIREAEARAREAEARAREAEAAAQEPVQEGIPYWWGWGGGGGILPPTYGPAHGPHFEPPRAEPPPRGPSPGPEPGTRPEPPPSTTPSSTRPSMVGPSQPFEPSGGLKPVAPPPQLGAASGAAGSPGSPRQD